MNKIEYNNITWLDIHKPKDKDIEEIKKDISLTSNVIKELLVPQKRPKIEEYDYYIFMVLHFPVFDPKNRKTHSAEIDFIITKEKIITLHQDTPHALKAFHNNLESHDFIKKEYFKNTGYLLLSMLDQIIDSCLPMLDHIHEKIDEIEDQVFKGKEKEMLTEISIVKRDIINFRRTIKPQRSILEILAKKSNRFFGEELTYLIQEVIGSNIRVWNTLENHKDMIEAIEETNNSSLSYKLNDIVKTLTLLSFITFPLALIAGIFAMNTWTNYKFIEEKNPYVFWWVVIFMILVTLLMFIYFKRKKWI